MKKRTQFASYLIIFIAMLFMIGFFFGNNQSLSFGLNILSFILIMRLGQLNQKRLDKKLDEMWQLADQLGMDETQLSQFSDLGSLDLAATKSSQRSYWPFSSQIKKTTRALKKIADDK